MYDVWICIPGYNGYEYCNKMVRSMKFFNIYPNGKIIKPRKDKKGTFYFLSNNQNEKKKVYVEDIERLIATNNVTCRGWNDTDISSRNKVTRKPVAHGKKQEIYKPTFKVIKPNAIRFY